VVGTVETYVTGGGVATTVVTGVATTWFRTAVAGLTMVGLKVRTAEVLTAVGEMKVGDRARETRTGPTAETPPMTRGPTLTWPTPVPMPPRTLPPPKALPTVVTRLTPPRTLAPPSTVPPVMVALPIL
jgi:hypothetical protein